MSDLLILDLETTASNVTPETEPIEVSFSVLTQDGNENNHQYKMKPDVPVLPCATVIHGQTQDDVDKLRPIVLVLKDIYEQFQKLQPDTIVAAYNAQFDVNVLDQAFQKYIQKRFQPKRVLDILRLAQKLLSVKKTGGHRLDAVFYYLFPNRLKELIDGRTTHSGSHDVDIETQVLMELWERAEKVSGYTNCTLDQLYEFAVRPMLVEEWGWGKHRGEKVLDVLKEDRSYVSWFMEKCDFRDQHPDLVFTIEQLQKGRSR